MTVVGTFEGELSRLKRGYEHDSFEYSDARTSFCSAVTLHFQNVQGTDRHGIYVVRQESKRRQVLYIGTSGTMDRDGCFKKQDIPHGLKNVKNDDVSANEWFKSLLKEKGQLVIEYVFLLATPESPTFVESLLLQAYFNEHKSLPYRNKSF